ncbi:hypothetical protein PHYSODRAFT_261596 [Phytophthora sojae]|uniref:ISXO2-like transposase domain-containing protein n=1 Tax=Phytophthora sojae (strain P6497) TaxID=1094619 RepID=G4YH24_PHYSP|nr:hypothetical protein PHYSODRAFT_261596 [Phytophthora sojae]EGZ27725.1 hypothetical protein PHYSODRAFT_261596 [Phytophthora sojae]|eukprot:XP_009515000.1 hypothetical protein PHYSODRAFT_261596 [Phytophthora sojae]
MLSPLFEAAPPARLTLWLPHSHSQSSRLLRKPPATLRLPVMSTASPYQYHLDDESLFAMDTVLKVTSEQALCVEWCIVVGLIDREKCCPKCQLLMRRAPTRKRWRCCRRTQHADGKEASRGLLTDSFFNESKLQLCSTVRLLLGWAMRLPQEQAAEWAELLRSEFKIGGDGMVVEIDETSLSKKRKYNQGRHYEEFWLFGGVDRGTGRWFGRVVRTKAMLLPIIKRFIEHRTHIMSDMFATYVCERGNKQHTLENNRTLLSMRYSHSWVNHSLNFVDPVYGPMGNEDQTAHQVDERDEQ